MQSQIRPAPVATPVRWERAFARATQYGATARRVGIDRWAVPSSNGILVYLVTASRAGLGCTCMAGQQQDPVCFHRAAVLAAAAIQPEPPTPGALAA